MGVLRFLPRCNPFEWFEGTYKRAHKRRLRELIGGPIAATAAAAAADGEEEDDEEDVCSGWIVWDIAMSSLYILLPYTCVSLLDSIRIAHSTILQASQRVGHLVPKSRVPLPGRRHTYALSRRT